MDEGAFQISWGLMVRYIESDQIRGSLTIRLWRSVAGLIVCDAGHACQVKLSAISLEHRPAAESPGTASVQEE